MTYESVNHPNHYTEGRNYEPDDVIEDWGLSYRLGCALKYLSRNGRKPGEDPIEGLEKAVWYINREIDSYRQASDYGVCYEDVLEDHAACALEGREGLYEYGNDQDIYVPFSDDSYLQESWDDATDCNCISLTEEEINRLFAGKDLSQLKDDQTVAVTEKNGTLFRVNKDRSYSKVGRLWQDNYYS